MNAFREKSDVENSAMDCFRSNPPLSIQAVLFSLVIILGNGCLTDALLHSQEVQNPSIDTVLAAEYFREAGELFKRDNARLWGKSLQGPILFVDHETHFAVANEADPGNVLSPRDGVFVGTLPLTVMVANTSVQWNGTKWTMVLWPLPLDADERAVLLAHEAWHRIQDKIGFPASGAANNHLNSLHGRYLLQLEWRALREALLTDGSEQLTATSDALHFRFYRQQLMPGCDAEERAMELHEGLAEYTGIRLALDAKKRLARSVSQLENRPKELETFVRSFAYLSGPAYGLLLDELDPDWIRTIHADSDLARLLQALAQIEVESDLESAVVRRSQKYGGELLWAAEKKRDDERIAQVALLTRKFTTGPRLVIPLENMNMSFNPNELVPLGETGTLYPTLTITDKWGVLKATGGAVISSDFQQVIVSVPADYNNSLKTTGWELELNKGWFVTAGFNGVFQVDKD